MQPTHILVLILGYFGVLYFISYITGKEDSNQAFFKANKKAPWYLVAFGMVGAALSGVTFISVPGQVEANSFSYLQLVLGNFVGLLVVTFVLIPIYYKQNVTSIYEYLDNRFGRYGHKAGASFFLLSRIIGASFRLFLVALAFQYLLFENWGVPFEITVIISILLIWLYTYKGGIKTIIWTDTLQTLLMLLSVGITFYLICNHLDWSISDFINSEKFASYNQTFFFDDFKNKQFFFKSFFGGLCMAVAMIGLDQDMMQKNLACKNQREAQKNMLSFATVFVLVNIVFLSLGALLYIYAESVGISVPILDGKPRTDLLFPEIAMNGKLGTGVAVFFILGLIAAAYSSADSALTSLTTSYCIDIAAIKSKTEEAQKRLRKRTHIIMSIILVVVIIIFNRVLERSVIIGLFTVATFTYGPLLGLFFFSILTKFKVKEKYILTVCILSVVISLLLNFSPTLFAYFNEFQLPDCTNSSWKCAEAFAGKNYYQFGFELLFINGLMTFLGLFLIRRK